MLFWPPFKALGKLPVVNIVVETFFHVSRCLQVFGKLENICKWETLARMNLKILENIKLGKIIS